ncbi:MAG: amidohydrolase family protein, partial [Kineosporiaceae bacterium]
PPYPRISDDEIRASIEAASCGSWTSAGWTSPCSPRGPPRWVTTSATTPSAPAGRACNDLVARVVSLYPDRFTGVGQLPQSPGAPITFSIGELRRCVEELGFVACNLSPDPSGGHWTSPPLSDRSWYRLYEVLVELDVPAMVHVSAVTNRSFHATGSHYLNADTTAFMQLVEADLLGDFPTVRLVIPHGGGAVPYQGGGSVGSPTCSAGPHSRTRLCATCSSTPASTPAGDRPALRRRGRRQHRLRLRDGRRRPGDRPADRAELVGADRRLTPDTQANHVHGTAG